MAVSMTPDIAFVDQGQTTMQGGLRGRRFLHWPDNRWSQLLSVEQSHPARYRSASSPYAHAAYGDASHCRTHPDTKNRCFLTVLMTSSGRMLGDSIPLCIP